MGETPSLEAARPIFAFGENVLRRQDVFRAVLP